MVLRNRTTSWLCSRDSIKKDEKKTPLLAECNIVHLQALGAMAAVGPHLSLKSWGPLFQAAGVLGCAALLPGSSSSGGGSDRDGRTRDDELFPVEGEGDDEGDCELWAALDALWEFTFLQASVEELAITATDLTVVFTIICSLAGYQVRSLPPGTQGRCCHQRSIWVAKLPI